MDVLVIMGAGVLAGMLLPLQKCKKAVSLGQTVCTLVLIFAMGAMLGGRADLMSRLGAIGLESLGYALAGIIGSVAVVYPLSRAFLDKRRDKEG